RERDRVGVVLADLEVAFQPVDVVVVERLRRVLIVPVIVTHWPGPSASGPPLAEGEPTADGDQPEADCAAYEQYCHHDLHGSSHHSGHAGVGGLMTPPGRWPR